MHGLTKVEQDVVSHVHYIVNRTDSFVHEEILQPLRTRSNSHIVQNTSGIKRCFFAFNGNRQASRSLFIPFSQRKFFEMNRLIIDSCYFVRHSARRQSVSPVWRDGKLDNLIIQVQIREDLISWYSTIWQNLDTIRKFLWHDRIRNSQLTERADHAQ